MEDLIFNSWGENFANIVNGNLFTKKIVVIYGNDGNLNSIVNPRSSTQYLTAGEWEDLYDFLCNTPPPTLPNPNYDLYRDISPSPLSLDSLKSIYYNALINEGNVHYIAILPNMKLLENNRSIKDYTDSVYDNRVNIKDINILKQDSLVGKMQWRELKHRCIESSQNANKGNKHHSINKQDKNKYNANFEKFEWVRIPIKNYNIDLQIPKYSKISLKSDSRSALIQFPHSSWLTIQYTKGDGETKLYDNETDFRNRPVSSNIITKQYILSKGEFEENGITTFWGRIRFRYGITVTLYSPKESLIDKYEETVLTPITIELRPKYKTIYLD